MQIKLPKLGRIIADCWKGAESRMQEVVPNKYPRPSEEELTFLLSGELRCEVDEASKRRRFEGAIKEDLRQHFADDQLRWFSDLKARVNFHSRTHEGRCSAADFGV